MRTLLAATAVLAMTASGAEAQRVARSGPVAMRPAPMARPAMRPAPAAKARPAAARTSGNWGHGQGWGHGSTPGHGWGGGNHPKPPRWGGHVQGRWWGGWRAPGGWGAYRRPVRGFILPSYWIAPNWFIDDWGSYGLPAPPAGYNWSRYYDDAVLVDGRGSVYDTIGGVNWDGYDEAGADYAYADQDRRDEFADSGVTGAGAPYDYPPPPHGAPPPPPPPPHMAPPPPPPPPYRALPRPANPVMVQSAGYYANGYYYPGATITTVTVTTAPVVTTTTEVFEDTVTYTRHPARRAWHRTWRARPKPKCVCS